jgi:hypothetical protein
MDMSTNNEIIAELECRLNDLYVEASYIVGEYWEAVTAMEKTRPGNKDRNKLRIRCLMVGNSIRTEWFGVSWSGKGRDGKFFDKKVHITKPANSFGYTLTKLYKFAHEWEKEIIDETESLLEEIRHQSHHLTRALISLRHAEALEVKRKTKVKMT